MTYRTIVVHLGEAARVDELLDVAMPLARRHRAHLVGMTVLPAPLIASFGLPDSPAPVLMEDYRRAYIAECERIRARFVERAGAAGVDWEFMLEDGWATSVAQTMLDAAGAADLIVAGQPGTGSPGYEQVDIADRLILESGRPVVLVPRQSRCATVGKRVVVGWNRRREAARAVFDAMPLLRLAQEVRVVCVQEGEAVASAGDAATMRVAAGLRRQGVACSAVGVPAADGEVGAVLLHEAAMFSADLLVMGCYGHSRLREFVLGGATRHVLSNMRLPVLMAH